MYLAPITDHNVHHGSMAKEASYALRKLSDRVSILYCT